MTTRQTTCLAFVCALVAAGLACSDDGGSEAETTATTETDSGDGDPGDGDGDPGDGDPGDGDGDPGDGDGDPSECGNGEVEDGEICDDGNDVDTDFCTNSCTNPCAPVWDTRELDVVEGNSIWVGDHEVAASGELVVGSQRQNGAERDAIVAMYNATGDTQMWETAIPSATGGSAAVTGLALADDGDVYVTGWRDAMDGEDLWVARVSGSDGSIVWEVEHDGLLDMSDDGGVDIAIAADGVVVTGTVYDVDQDSDIFIRKLDWDGNELWTTTYSGALAPNGYGLDGGGPVAVADDGTVYVLGRVYVSFDTIDVVLLSYSSDGMGPDWELTPGSGDSGHDYSPDTLRLDGAGNIYAAFTDVDSPIGTFAIHKYATADATELWTLGNAELAVDENPENWIIDDLRADGSRLVILGSWFNETYLDSLTRREIYAAHFDTDGNPLCYGGFGETGGGDTPYAAISTSLSWTDGGAPIGYGAVFREDTIDLWLAEFGSP